MANYKLPVDIGNRALQHCGAPRITSFSDQSKNAAAVGFAYDKVRQAELRRNVWRYAIRKVALRAVDINTMFLEPAQYQAADTYIIGSIVSWQDVIYFATAAVPINSPPDSNPTLWTVYFGPLTVMPWSAEGAGYFSGELVYVLTGKTVSVFMSLQNGNTDDPSSIAQWDPTVTYFQGDTVSTATTGVLFNGAQVLFNGTDVFFNSGIWESAIDLNLNNEPGASPAWEYVPPTQPDVMAGRRWLQLNAKIVHERIVYPLAAGPQSQIATRNIFHLPSGYLDKAPQDPTAGAVSYLGAPSGLGVSDWTFEGDWIVSRDQTVIVLRFVADVADVTLMDPLFCEGLAARLALEVVEELTQSQGKLQAIGQLYKLAIGDARAVNGIETGFVEPPLDDYISCRV